MLLCLSSVGFPLALSALLVGAFSTPAHAYLDPGTGSMILQLLLGGVAGAAVAGRFYWNRLLSLLGVRSSANKRETPGDVSAPPDHRAE